MGYRVGRLTYHVSALARFTIAGPASAGRTRVAGLLDGLAATVVAMVAVPQPVVRQFAMAAVPGAGGIALFVGLLLASVAVVLWLYLAFSAVNWGRSPAMYLLDLGLEAPTKPTIGEAASWALGWMIALLPALIGARGLYDPERGLPARLSGVPTRATVPTTDEA